jgi:hypothetical protein
MLDQAVPSGLKLGPSFQVVEQLTVKHDAYTPVLIANRLLTIGQADDAESPRTKRQARPLQVALFVGAAVKNRLRHPLDDPIL